VLRELPQLLSSKNWNQYYHQHQHPKLSTTTNDQTGTTKIQNAINDTFIEIDKNSTSPKLSGGDVLHL
jgi:hypothetical protein